MTNYYSVEVLHSYKSDIHVASDADDLIGESVSYEMTILHCDAHCNFTFRKT